MSQTLEEIQDELVEEFSFLEDWMDKYEMIIDMGTALEGLPESDKSEQWLVRGCQSQVWIKPRKENGLLYFDVDSDAMITKGIAGMVARVVSGRKPAEIAHADLNFIQRIGLREHLSPNRANGLLSMVQKIKTYALTYDKIPD
ncbi:MAG: SufE family protein [Flavobacteriales bacterium]|jgi:cysteine desulfuration protein SufE|nr:SufE family protein [Flavobacteriales bacterium]